MTLDVCSDGDLGSVVWTRPILKSLMSTTDGHSLPAYDVRGDTNTHKYFCTGPVQQILITVAGVISIISMYCRRIGGIGIVSAVIAVAASILSMGIID